jgi:hypothetical protein
MTRDDNNDNDNIDDDSDNNNNNNADSIHNLMTNKNISYQYAQYWQINNT